MSQILTIDLCDSKLLVSEFASAPEDGPLLRLPGRLHGSQPSGSCQKRSSRLYQLSDEGLNDKLLQAPKVVFGAHQDPFEPPHGRFDLALQVLEKLISFSPKSFMLQSRSPLVLLATPLISPFGKNAAVTIAFESLDDTANRHHTPLFPRPSERLKTAQALHDIGIHVIAQVAPIATTPHDLRSLRSLANALKSACSDTRLITFSSLLIKSGYQEAEYSPTLQAFTNPRLSRACLKLLQKQLETAAPAWPQMGQEYANLNEAAA